MLSSKADPAQRAPFVVAHDITDPSELDLLGDLLVIDAHALELDRVQVRRVIVDLAWSQLVYHSTNVPVRTRTRFRGEGVGFAVFGPSTRGLMNGTEVGPGRVAVTAEAVEVRVTAAPSYESLVVLVRESGLDRDDEHPLQAGLRSLSKSFEIRHCDTDAANDLFDRGKEIATRAATSPLPDAEVEEQRRDLHRLLMRSLAAVVDGLGSLVRARSSDLRHEQIVSAVEKLTDAQLGDRPTVRDLCERAGVGERTLQYAFKEALHISPTQYLKRRRLVAVRRALREATPDSTNVTREATNRGFSRLGDFSRTYRESFGELPSETLREKSEI